MTETASMQRAVEQVILAAKDAGGILRTGETARRLFSESPDSGLSPRDIAELVVRQAVAAGVPIQFTSPD